MTTDFRQTDEKDRKDRKDLAELVGKATALYNADPSLFVQAHKWIKRQKPYQVCVGLPTDTPEQVEAGTAGQLIKPKDDFFASELRRVEAAFRVLLERYDSECSPVHMELDHARAAILILLMTYVPAFDLARFKDRWEWSLSELGTEGPVKAREWLSSILEPFGEPAVDLYRMAIETLEQAPGTTQTRRSVTERVKSILLSKAEDGIEFTSLAKLAAELNAGQSTIRQVIIENDTLLRWTEGRIKKPGRRRAIAGAKKAGADTPTDPLTDAERDATQRSLESVSPREQLAAADAMLKHGRAR